MSDNRTGLQPIWLDCDPGHDDAIAILLALHLPRLALMGISTVGSNADVGEATHNAARLLHAFGGRRKDVDEIIGEDYPLKVYSGAAKPLLRQARHDPEIHGEDGLGGVKGLLDPQEADVQKYLNQSTDHQDLTSVSEHIKRAVFKSKEKRLGDLIIVSTGGLTNIALLVSSYPSLLGPGAGVKEIVFMGGAIGTGNRGPTSEFNVLFDPEAAKIVCDCRCKVVMVPLNVTHMAIWHDRLHKFLLNPSTYHQELLSDQKGAEPPMHIEALTPLRYTLSTLFEFFKSTYLKTFGFENGPPIHDGLCLIYLVQPNLFQGKRSKVEIECNSRWCDGTTVVDIWGDRDAEFADQDLMSDDWSGPTGKNVWVAHSIDIAPAWKLLLRAVHEADLVSPLNSRHVAQEKEHVWLSAWVEPHESIVTPSF